MNVKGFKVKANKIIRKHKDAQVALAFLGAEHPDNWDSIQEEAKLCEANLRKFLKEVQDYMQRQATQNYKLKTEQVGYDITKLN